MKFKVKKEIFRILPLLSPFVNFTSLINAKKNPVFLPFYHCVSDSPPDYIQALYRVKSVEVFKAELDFISLNFTPVDLSELIDLKSKGIYFKNGKPIVHFSFDDGLMSCQEVIAPLLIDKGIPATFFVAKNFVESQDEFFRFRIGKILVALRKLNNPDVHRKVKLALKEAGYHQSSVKTSLLALNQEDHLLLTQIADTCGLEWGVTKDFLNKSEVQALKDMGFSIGAHSISHPLFSTLNEERIVEEITNSISWVQQNFRSENNTFAFPFTDDGVPDGVFKRIFSMKEPFLELSFGTAGLKFSEHKNHLQRVPMELYSTDPFNRVKKEYMYHQLQSAIFGHPHSI